MATTAFPTRDDFEALLNESLGGENETFEGKVVKGIVTGIENDLAVIDVGLKSEGRVPLREFAAPGQKAELKVGDEVEVFVDRVENSVGEAMLSRDRARREAAWDKLEKEFEKGERVQRSARPGAATRFFAVAAEPKRILQDAASAWGRGGSLYDKVRIIAGRPWWPAGGRPVC